ncbi:MAG: FAD:protein FMN transferase, partial [Sphingobacteriales bacterium]
MPALDTKQCFRRAERLMGNQFLLTAVAADSGCAGSALNAAIAEIQRVEKLLTTFSDDSETTRINAAAGVGPVPVSAEVFQLIERAQRISGLTQGAFDLSYGSLDKRFWNFDKNMTALPDADEARQLVRLIDYRNIVLNPAAQTIFLKEKGMRIGFGGIGKGYAAERAKQVLVQHGISSGVVNASGDLCAWGAQPDGKPWTVGIA